MLPPKFVLKNTSTAPNEARRNNGRYRLTSVNPLENSELIFIEFTLPSFSPTEVSVSSAVNYSSLHCFIININLIIIILSFMSNIKKLTCFDLAVQDIFGVMINMFCDFSIVHRVQMNPCNILRCQINDLIDCISQPGLF